MKFNCKVTPDFALVPVDDEGIKYLYRRNEGDIISCEVKQERNYPFLKKAMALVKVVHESLPEPEMVEHKGKMIQPIRTFDDTRKYLTILAGEYDIIGLPSGKVRAEARSWSFGKMTSDEFNTFYSNLIDACLKALPRTWSADELERVAGRVVEFV